MAFVLGQPLHLRSYSAGPTSVRVGFQRSCVRVPAPAVAHTPVRRLRAPMTATAARTTQSSAKPAQLDAPTAAAEAAASAASFHPSLMDPVHERTERIRGEPLAIVVLGASGDLAKKKCFPALFSLFYHDLLPEDFVVYGFARSDMSDAEFRNLILGTLSCRVIDGEKCAAKMDEFLPKCFYHRGDYKDDTTFASLDVALSSGFEIPHATANRLFYLAVPPSVFYSSAKSIDTSCRAPCGWTRVVVEKPFGRDSESYRVLRDQLAGILDESEIYRIDHFLGKVLIQNLMTLRFANTIFEPLWNRDHVMSVQIGVFATCVLLAFCTLYPTQWSQELTIFFTSSLIPQYSRSILA
jgi:Glucose-6-phosphate dehydrogenase, NAD binding domain/Glucose-6-phosphate dehydrogenase, C-terminal domain